MCVLNVCASALNWQWYGCSCQGGPARKNKQQHTSCNVHEPSYPRSLTHPLAHSRAHSRARAHSCTHALTRCVAGGSPSLPSPVTHSHTPTTQNPPSHHMHTYKHICVITHTHTHKHTQTHIAAHAPGAMHTGPPPQSSHTSRGPCTSTLQQCSTVIDSSTGSCKGCGRGCGGAHPCHAKGSNAKGCVPQHTQQLQS